MLLGRRMPRRNMSDEYDDGGKKITTVTELAVEIFVLYIYTQRSAWRWPLQP